MKWEIRALFCATNANLCWVNQDAGCGVTIYGAAWLVCAVLCIYGAFVYDEKT